MNYREALEVAAMRLTLETVMSTKKNPYTPWQDFKTTCNRGRVTYHPEWDATKPWASYINGTAGPHFASPESAIAYFTASGMTLLISRNPFTGEQP